MGNSSKTIRLPLIENFELRLPIRDTAISELVKVEIFTTDQILKRSESEQQELRTELEYIITRAFPQMPEHERKEYVSDYFQLARGNSQRQGLLFRHKKRLIGTGLFDQGIIEYDGSIMIGIYGIMRAVLSEYQSFGIGQLINMKILNELKPDILFANTYQSRSLHAWLGLFTKGLVTGYEIYPRFEKQNGKEVIVTVPYKDMDFIISAFRQMFLIFIQHHEIVDDAVNNLTVRMVRKNAHEELYDFHPWEKNGKIDKYAAALGASEKDGILVMIRKIRAY